MSTFPQKKSGYEPEKPFQSRALLVVNAKSPCRESPLAIEPSKHRGGAKPGKRGSRFPPFHPVLGRRRCCRRLPPPQLSRRRPSLYNDANLLGTVHGSPPTSCRSICSQTMHTNSTQSRTCSRMGKVLALIERCCLSRNAAVRQAFSHHHSLGGCLLPGEVMGSLMSAEWKLWDSVGASVTVSSSGSEPMTWSLHRCPALPLGVSYLGCGGLFFMAPSISHEPLIARTQLLITVQQQR